MKALARIALILFTALVLIVFSFSVHYAYEELFGEKNTAHAMVAAPRPAAILSLKEAESEIVTASAGVMPCVVAVSTEQKISLPGRKHPFADDPFFRDFFGEDRFWFTPPREGINRGLGSGVIVDPKGIVLTNHHVIADADKITLTLEDGRDVKAEVLGSDERMDIAVLKIKDKGEYKAAAMGNSEDLRVGMIVLAVGTPFNKRLSQSVTMGIISALGRSGLNIEQVENLIQTDAAINQGNSGGPLVNLNGEVIGINAAIISGGGAGNDGIGFAIPINSAKFILDSILEHGKVIRGYLGVSIQDLSDDLRANLGLKSSHGALISEVMKGSPAGNAGLRTGDVIVEWNGKKVKSASSLTEAVGTTTAGATVPVIFYRDGKKLTADVTVVERPSSVDEPSTKKEQSGDEEEAEPIDRLGISVKWIQGEPAKKLRLPEEGCVVVTSTKPGSVAERLGIAPGTGILEANQKPIASVEDLTNALKSKKKLTLLLRYRNANRYIAINQ